uniref:Uncharacterized protein n=1 Tax=Candidatus Giovannonibacteria bacterium GW2011_GWF2_42_19 TaxID=1618659 RepID=A0A0G0ZG54_9BACT|nr:MAG: hypothetical protein UV11_C0014G0009 [Candidatus Giovannonibacteria bacterium GW2011_GWF2_42_19]
MFLIIGVFLFLSGVTVAAEDIPYGEIYGKLEERLAGQKEVIIEVSGGAWLKLTSFKNSIIVSHFSGIRRLRAPVMIFKNDMVLLMVIRADDPEFKTLPQKTAQYLLEALGRRQREDSKLPFFITTFLSVLNNLQSNYIPRAYLDQMVDIVHCLRYA